MPRVVITGTRHGRPDVEHWLRRYVAAYGVPSLWVLGDARGVDAQALALCDREGWPRRVVDVDPQLPSPDRFHDRNQRMVDLCEPGDRCLAFPDDASRGTWDCLGRARRAGLRVRVLPLASFQVEKPEVHPPKTKARGRPSPAGLR